MSVVELQKPLSRHMRSLKPLRQASQMHPVDFRSLRQIANIQHAAQEYIVKPLLTRLFTHSIRNDAASVGY